MGEVFAVEQVLVMVRCEHTPDHAAQPDSCKNPPLTILPRICARSSGIQQLCRIQIQDLIPPQITTPANRRREGNMWWIEPMARGQDVSLAGRVLCGARTMPRRSTTFANVVCCMEVFAVEQVLVMVRCEHTPGHAAQPDSCKNPPLTILPRICARSSGIQQLCRIQIQDLILPQITTPANRRREGNMWWIEPMARGQDVSLAGRVLCGANTMPRRSTTFANVVCCMEVFAVEQLLVMVRCEHTPVPAAQPDSCKNCLESKPAYAVSELMC